MLGFDCYAEVSLATKMASTPQQVLDFLGELAAKARPYAERDLAELCQFAADKLQLEKLEAWDLAYASEKLRVDRYAFSEQEVKQYFPKPVCCRECSSWWRISMASLSPRRVEAGIQLWHPDVKFFNIRDGDGKLIGQFYLDLYARPGKRGGGWMDDAISRRRVGTGEPGEQGIQAPVAYLNCNFSAPVS